MTVRPTHYPGGISNTSPGDPLYMFPYLDPTQFHTWWNDFDNYTAADWTVTKTTSSGIDRATTGDGGVLSITPGTADVVSSMVSAQWDGNSGAAVVENFAFSTSKYWFLKVRAKLSEVTNSKLLLGCAITDTTPFSTTAQLALVKAGGAATIAGTVTSASTSSSVTAGTIVADTYFTAAMVNNVAAGVIQVFFNGSLIGTMATTNTPTVTLAPTIAFVSEAASVNLLLDYMLIALER